MGSPLLLCGRAGLWYTQAGSEVIAALSHTTGSVTEEVPP